MAARSVAAAAATTAAAAAAAAAPSATAAANAAAVATAAALQKKTGATTDAASVKSARIPLKIVSIVGSARNEAPPWGGPARLGTRVAAFVHAGLRARGHGVTVVDPLDPEVADEAGLGSVLRKPAFYYKQGKSEEEGGPPPALAKINAALKEADAIVVVSAEYNHSVPPALSNVLDHFGGSVYANKPSGICCYSPGPWGGMRAAMALRPLLAELGCISTSNIFGVGKAQDLLDEEGNPTDEGKRLEGTFDRWVQQVEWWAEAAKARREIDVAEAAAAAAEEK